MIFHEPFLRILASYEAKIAKICNFWPVRDDIKNSGKFAILGVGQKGFLLDFEKIVY